jgi:hypothetical protein
MMVARCGGDESGELGLICAYQATAAEERRSYWSARESGMPAMWIGEPVPS